MTRALLIVAGVVLWAVAMALYFHETHVNQVHVLRRAGANMSWPDGAEPHAGPPWSVGLPRTGSSSHRATCGRTKPAHDRQRRCFRRAETLATISILLTR